MTIDVHVLRVTGVSMKSSLIHLLLFVAILFCSGAVFGQQSANEVLNRFSHEPDIQSVQQAAIEYAGISDSRLSSLYTRAGISRLLPKSAYYQFRYRDEDRSRKTNESQFDGGASEPKALKEVYYEQPLAYMQHDARASWELSGLIFNADQLRVAREMANASKVRDKLVGDVTKTYFERRKLQVAKVLNPADGIDGQLSQDLAIQEKTARLDAFTGGWFSAQLRKAGH